MSEDIVMSDTKKDKRRTQQQALIRGLFEHSGRPLSAQELLDAAASIQPGIGIATIYRGIKQLLDDNTLVPVDIPGTAPRYERNGMQHHHHFFCQKCFIILKAKLYQKKIYICYRFLFSIV